MTLQAIAFLSKNSLYCGVSNPVCLDSTTYSSRLVVTPRITIQKNRTLNLILLYICGIIGVDRQFLFLEEYQCRSIAIGVHFFALNTFFWTALEGIHLYRSLIIRVSVDDDGKYSNLLRYTFSYGCSIAIIFLTLGVTYAIDATDAYRFGSSGVVGIKDYGDVCWLKETTFIWSFLTPVALIIVFNTYVMMRALYIASKVNPKTSLPSKVHNSIKGCLILTHLLGLSWAVGFFSVLSPGIVYLVVILNTSNGIFILMHTLIFDKVLMTEAKVRLGISKDTAISYNGRGPRLAAIKKISPKKTPKSATETSVETTSMESFTSDENPGSKVYVNRRKRSSSKNVTSYGRINGGFS